MGRLYTILDKLADKATTPAIIMRSVNGDVQKTAGKSVQLAAPTVTGYTFVCWVYATTNGWTGYVSPANPSIATVNFYVQYSASPSTDTGGITGFALYRAD